MKTLQVEAYPFFPQQREGKDDYVNEGFHKQKDRQQQIQGGTF